MTPGFFALGSRNLQAFAFVHFSAQRTGDRLLSTTSVEFGAQVLRRCRLVGEELSKTAYEVP